MELSFAGLPAAEAGKPLRELHAAGSIATHRHDLIPVHLLDARAEELPALGMVQLMASPAPFCVPRASTLTNAWSSGGPSGQREDVPVLSSTSPVAAANPLLIA